MPQGFIDFLKQKQETFNFPDSDRFSVFAINYGGRDEIIRGINSILADQKEITTITVEELSKHMDLGNLPPVEMVIRTK